MQVSIRTLHETALVVSLKAAAQGEPAQVSETELKRFASESEDRKPHVKGA